MDTRENIVDTFRLIAEQLRRHDIMHMDAITFLPVIEEGIRMMDIVRCRDCKYGEKVNSVYLCGKARGFGTAHNPAWFCADGERRTDDA